MNEELRALSKILNLEDFALPPDWEEISQKIEKTDFDSGGRVHNWRNHIPSPLADIWGSLSAETRACLYVMAEELSNDEHWD